MLFQPINLPKAVIYVHLYFSFYTDDPRIKISSSPSFNTFPVGVPLNLTCIASQNDEVPKKFAVNTRPVSVQWFNPQNNPIGHGCQAGLSEATVVGCTLMVSSLAIENVGNYTCRARSKSFCSFKSIEVNLNGKGRNRLCKITLSGSELPPFPL